MPETIYHHGIYDAKPGLIPWAYVAGEFFNPILRVGATDATMAAIIADCGASPNGIKWNEVYRELSGILKHAHVWPPDGALHIELPKVGRAVVVEDDGFLCVTDQRPPWRITPASLDAARKAIARAAEQGSGDDPGAVIGAPRNYPGGDAVWLEVLRHGLGDALAGYVLDLGCGPGRVARIVAPYAKFLTGVDVSPHVIAAANDPARWDVPSNAEFMIGDGVTIPCPDASFDVVYSMFVFQHLTPLAIRENYLREIRRVLRPGGKALIETKVRGVGLSWWHDHIDDWGVDVSWCSEDEAVRVLEEYGFKVTRAWTMYGNQEPGALWLWTTLESDP